MIPQQSINGVSIHTAYAQLRPSSNIATCRQILPLDTAEATSQGELKEELLPIHLRRAIRSQPMPNHGFKALHSMEVHMRLARRAHSSLRLANMVGVMSLAELQCRSRRRRTPMLFFRKHHSHMSLKLSKTTTLMGRFLEAG